MATISVTLFVESEVYTQLELSSSIGVTASAGWEKGEPRGKTGKTYTTNSWKQVEKTFVQDDPDVFPVVLERCVESVLDRIDGCERQFREIASNSISGLLIGISAKQIPPLILSGKLLSRIALLGVDVELDVVLQ